MENESSHIKHQFDIWHVTKNIKKKMVKKAKNKSCPELFCWVKAIVNHFWWWFAFCVGAQELKEKWVSIHYQITDQHSCENHDIVKPCDHPDLRFDKTRKWLQVGSSAYIALEKIVTDRNLLNDLRYLCSFSQMGNLEVLHSLYNEFCSKQLNFSMYAMIFRTMTAVLDYNCMVNLPQTATSNNDLRYKQVFSGVFAAGWCVKKTRHYIQEILAEAFFQKQPGKY